MATPGTTSERGYGQAHQQLRQQWEPVVEAGQASCRAATCLMPSRWIPPGSPWDMGHTDDRAAWTGPEHRRCNRSAGARKHNRQRRARTAARIARLGDWATSRRW